MASDWKILEGLQQVFYTHSFQTFKNRLSEEFLKHRGTMPNITKCPISEWLFVTCLCEWHPGSKSEKRSPHLRRFGSDSSCTKAQEHFGQMRGFANMSLKLHLKILVGAANKPSYDQPCLKPGSSTETLGAAMSLMIYQWFMNDLWYIVLHLLNLNYSTLLVCLLGGVPGIRSAEEL